MFEGNSFQSLGVMTETGLSPIKKNEPKTRLEEDADRKRRGCRNIVMEKKRSEKVRNMR